jgi:hypothetical protein
MTMRDVDDQVKRLQDMQAKLIFSSDPAYAIAVEQALATAYVARELSKKH